MTISRRRKNAYTLIEILLALALVFIVIFGLSQVKNMISRFSLRSSADKLAANLEECRSSAAANSSADPVQITFRPTDGPYSGYTIAIKGKPDKKVDLPKSVRIINANKLIKNHAIRIGANGQYLDEANEPVRNPDPGMLTMTSTATDQVITLIIDPKTGRVSTR